MKPPSLISFKSAIRMQATVLLVENSSSKFKLFFPVVPQIMIILTLYHKIRNMIN